MSLNGKLRCSFRQKLKYSKNNITYQHISIFPILVSHCSIVSCLMKVSGNDASAVHVVHFDRMKIDVIWVHVLKMLLSKYYSCTLKLTRRGIFNALVSTEGINQSLTHTPHSQRCESLWVQLQIISSKVHSLKGTWPAKAKKTPIKYYSIRLYQGALISFILIEFLIFCGLIVFISENQSKLQLPNKDAAFYIHNISWR